MDEELIKLKNRLILAIIVIVVFSIPIYFYFNNKFGDKQSKILQSINNKDSLVLFITEDNCSDCEKKEKILKEKNVNYTFLNKDREEKYKEILRKIDFIESDINTPTIIYIVDGVPYSFLVKPSKNELLSYIEINNLSSSKEVVK